MKIGIQAANGSFSDRWISYCKQEGISYKIVDCYANDIINQLDDCNAFMWHHHHGNFKNTLVAKQLLFSIEQAGKIVFPNFNTGWHFDDKVAQKYLLEAIGAPIVPTYVFYTKESALEWIKTISFPKVFKLRSGAGASNVRLVKTRKDADRLIKKAFGRGFSQFNRIGNFKEKIRRFREGKDSFLGVIKGVARLFIPTDFSKDHFKEKGYIYFQDFIPNNDHDIRVIVVGDKAFAIKRMTRENDFRASGSGNIIYDKKEIPENCIKIAFDVSKKLNAQCLGYDFVFDGNGNPLLVEMSYGFSVVAYNSCPGFWDENLNWHEGTFNPQAWMVDYVIKNYDYLTQHDDI